MAVDIATVAIKITRNIRSTTLATDSHSSLSSSCFSFSFARSAKIVIPSSNLSCAAVVCAPRYRILFSLLTELMKSRELKILSPTLGAITRTSLGLPSMSVAFPFVSANRLANGLPALALLLVGFHFRLGFSRGFITKRIGPKTSIRANFAQRGTFEVGPVFS